MQSLVQDLRFALRMLRRRWMITALAVLSLALAIGGNTAVFSMVDAFMFRPLPFPEPERMVLVGERERTTPEFSGAFGSSLPSFADWRERSRSVAEWAAMQPRTLSLRGADRAEPISGVAATPSVFSVLRAAPTRGRLFGPEETVEGGRGVALLSHEFWIERWGEGTDPLGEVLTLNGEPHEVIGVMPPRFGFMVPTPDVWVPLTRSPASAARDERSLFVFGRLAEGTSMEAVRAEMAGMAETLEQEHPDTQRGWTVDVYNVRYDIPNTQSRILFAMLQGSVMLVLLIACVNIINLLLARGQERAREIALRTSLGAGRGRIVRQLLTETSIMAAAGAALGLALGAVGVRMMAAQFADVLPPGFEMALDGRVLSFTALLSVLAGLLFGVAPSLQTFRIGQAETLKQGGGRAGSGRSRKTLTRVLVVAEIALSFVALGGGSLLVRSFLQLQNTDPGFVPGNVLTAQIRIPTSSLPDDERRALFLDDVLDRLRRLPRVEAAAMASALPQTPIASADSFRVDGAPVDAGAPPPRAVVVKATPGYASALGVGLVQGRFLEPADRLDGAAVAVVDRALATERFGTESPIGRRITVLGASREIVGVVENVQQVLIRSGPTASGETIYLPAAQSPAGVTSMLLRTGGSPRELEAPLRTALEGLDADLTVAQVMTLEEYVDQFFVGVQVFNYVLGGFGLVALLLASLGTYGVLAYSVSRRSREIGIRMALGAEAGQVVRMIARQGVWLGAIGLAIGVVLTVPLVALMRSVMQNLGTIQPATLVLIGGVLFAVTLLASWVPAGRAATVDPVRTLRQE